MNLTDVLIPAFSALGAGLVTWGGVRTEVRLLGQMIEQLRSDHDRRITRAEDDIKKLLRE